MQSSAEQSAIKKAEHTLALLGVVEDIRWLVAGLVATLVHYLWKSPIGAALAFVAVLAPITIWHNRKRKVARDEFERLTGTGKYL
jgi:hypothetical protein